MHGDRLAQGRQALAQHEMYSHRSLDVCTDLTHLLQGTAQANTRRWQQSSRQSAGEDQSAAFETDITRLLDEADCNFTLHVASLPPRRVVSIRRAVQTIRRRSGRPILRRPKARPRLTRPCADLADAGLHVVDLLPQAVAAVLDPLQAGQMSVEDGSDLCHRVAFALRVAAGSRQAC